ncbi:hypothetical protein O3Q51_15820 [Cryomorphaceae bacterium 1068]|nr:hypothetical protein [Cryomorphaceae bacterium 1068]
MLGILRKLRRKESRFTRYLLYAIGEIFLIIIGIYCAVQLNNWNEGKKQSHRVESLIDKYEAELYLTINNAEWDLKNGLIYDSLIQATLADQVTIDDYWETPILETMITKTFSLDPARDNLDKILEQEESLPEKYEPIIVGMKSELFWMNRDDFYRETFWKSAEENMNYFNINYSWARKADSLDRHEAYTFYLTNPEFKNRLYAHWVHMERYLKSIHYYRKSAIMLLIDLKVYRDGLNADELRSFYAALGLNEPVTLDCAGGFNGNRSQGEEFTFVTNLSSDTVRFDNFDSEDQMNRKYVLAPNDSRYTRTRWGNGDLMPPRIIEGMVNGTCVERLAEVNDGYLVFD